MDGRALVVGFGGVEPAKDPEGAERVPATWLTDGFGEWQGEGFGVGIFEDPAAVGLAFAFDELDGFGEARGGVEFGFGAGVFVEAWGGVGGEGGGGGRVGGRGIGEFEKFGVGDFAGGAAAE